MTKKISEYIFTVINETLEVEYMDGKLYIDTGSEDYLCSIEKSSDIDRLIRKLTEIKGVMEDEEEI